MGDLITPRRADLDQAAVLASVLRRRGEYAAAEAITVLADDLDYTRRERDQARKAVRAARADSVPREQRIAPAPDLGVGGHLP